MKRMLLLFLLFSLPSFTSAFGDESPDIMGFYFDPEFPLEDITVPASVPFNVYAVVRNPTLANINGFEFGYDHWVPAGMEGLVLRLQTFPPPGIIWIDPPQDPLTGTYSLAFATPIPTSSYTVLMGWQYMLLSDFMMGFYMTGGVPSTIPGGNPGYVLDDVLVPCGIAETCFLPTSGGGVFVNAWCPLPAESLSWGTVKGLYR